MLPHRPGPIAARRLLPPSANAVRDKQPRLTYSLFISNFPKFAKLKHRRRRSWANPCK
jgi:hypothetical protein